MKRILLVRFRAIGDCVMAVPVATALRRTYPDAEIIWAVEELSAPVIDTDRLVNDLQVLPRRRWKQERWSPRTWREQILSYTRLRSIPIDLAIDLQGHSKTALMVRLSGAKKRLGSHATDAFAARLNPLAVGDYLSGHSVDWNLEVLRQASSISRPAEWMMPAVDRRWAEVVISVGASTKEKQVPTSHWEELGNTLIAAGHAVTFLGGPADPIPNVPGSENLVGKLNLRQSMGVAASARLHVSGDTGMGHIAAAYGVPTVSIFGDMPPERFRPYGSQSTVLRAASQRPEDVPFTEILDACLARLEEHA